MAPLRALLTRLVSALDFFSGSFTSDLQKPIDLQPSSYVVRPQSPSYPIWTPPDDLEDPTFRCEYPDYRAEDGWVMCNTNTDRSCWLKNTKTKQQYNITIDYETDGPRGVLREYYLELNEHPYDPDGYGQVFAQLFNNSLPGPRIQACWGDRVTVTVKNNLPLNGTTVHWHGLRQLNTGWNDGVNAITQCPIPPGANFTYEFNITQYGTSWYHSHFSLQYAAGLLGPMTLYGPTSANYDHQVQPLIMSDWTNGTIYPSPNVTNILQNGTGHYPQLTKVDIELGHYPSGKIPKFNEITFQQGVRYLLRLVNGAADTSFVFSIDNHTFDVISADFVPIKPYRADYINVGIGQRYQIVVEAKPDIPNLDGNYWIRTIPATGCTGWNASKIDGLTGIVRYSSIPKLPTSKRRNFSIDCADETYNHTLKPIVNWTVETKSMLSLPPFYLHGHTVEKQPCPYLPCGDDAFHFELVPSNPLWLNFSNATILNPFQDFSKKPWLAEINTDTTKKEKWVNITIISGQRPKHKAPSFGRPAVPNPGDAPPGLSIPNYHPIHLHGHDFAILAQCVPDGTNKCDPTKAVLNTKNPPRRDVAFLPDSGYLILAFKADNPGAWILHCHIADHASLGLAAQILENADKMSSAFGFGWDETTRDQCTAWSEYCKNDGADCAECQLQNDSGI